MALTVEITSVVVFSFLAISLTLLCLHYQMAKKRARRGRFKRMRSHHHSSSAKEESSVSIPDVSNEGTERRSTLRSISSWFEAQTSLKRVSNKKQIKSNCYVTPGGKVMCNEELQTDGGLYIGCTLNTLLAEESKAKLKPLLVPRNDVTLGDKIGCGAFGTVWQGTLSNPNALGDTRDLVGPAIKRVAIKTIKDACSNEDIKSIVEEGLVMAECNHPHLMYIMGVAIDDEVGLPMLIMPLMENRDLCSYLRSFRYDEDCRDKEVPTDSELLVFGLQIARGMEYLASQKFVHRDLATRNCMLDSRLVVRVADFGLAKDNYYYLRSREVKLPIRWMSIESIQDRYFSVSSDVWSYGVTLWEIFTMAQMPYASLDNADILKYLQDGKRLEIPACCNETVSNLLSQCWEADPKQRPSFNQIAKTLDSILHKDKHYLSMDDVFVVDETEDTPSLVIESREMDTADDVTQLHITELPSGVCITEV